LVKFGEIFGILEFSIKDHPSQANFFQFLRGNKITDFKTDHTTYFIIVIEACGASFIFPPDSSYLAFKGGNY
jgi:hypothetical protein